MMEDIFGWFYFKPSRILELGKAILYFGFGLLISGFIGMVGVAIDRMPWVHASVGSLKELAEIYPDFPTWWIPESLFGFGFAVALIVIGFILAIRGKKYMEIMGEHDW